MEKPHGKYLMSTQPNSIQLVKKSRRETLESLEDNENATNRSKSNTDTGEHPINSISSKIMIPVLFPHGGFHQLKLTKMDYYLNQPALGEQLETKILEKIKNIEKCYSNPTNEALIENKLEDSVLNSNFAPRLSKRMGPEQLKILQEQIKEKEILKSTINEIKKKRAKVSLFIFSNENKFRQKQIIIAESKYFSIIIVMVTIVNISAICLENFSLRLHKYDETLQYQSSPFSFYLELACNIFFYFVFINRTIAFGFILGNKTYLKSAWNVVAFVVLFGTILIYIPDSTCIAIGKSIRCLRPIAILDEIRFLKKTTNAFIKTLFSISKILIQIIFVMIFAAIFGLNIFNGLLESRCRLTPEPIDGMWVANPNITTLCGYSICPENNYCINPSNYDFPENHTELDIVSINYGLANYDNFLMAFLTNMSYMTFTGWSKINDFFGTAFNKVIVSFYSILLLLIMGLVFLNLLMAALYDGFIKNRQGIKAHRKKKTIDNDNTIRPENQNPVPHFTPNACPSPKKQNNGIQELEIFESSMLQKLVQKAIQKNFDKNNKPQTITSFEPNLNFDYPNFTIDYKPHSSPMKIFSIISNIIISKHFNIFILLCLVLNIIIFAMDRVGISTKESFYLEILNLACTIIFFIEISVRFIVLGPKEFWKNHFDKLDLIIILLNMTDILYIALSGADILAFSTSLTGISLIKCFKTLRIFRFLVGLKYWKRGSILFIEMINALAKTKEFIFLIIILIFVGSLLGMQLFAYRIRYINENEIPEEISMGFPTRLNYDNIGNALMATTLICLNEEWHLLMYENMRILGVEVGWYFIIILMIGEILLIRMFMALFINYVIHSENIKNLIKMQNSLENIMKSFLNNIKNKRKMKEKVLDVLYFWKKQNKTEKEKEITPSKLVKSEIIKIPDIFNNNSELNRIPSNLFNRKSMINQKNSNNLRNSYFSVIKSTTIKFMNDQESLTIKKDGFLNWLRSVCMKIVTHKYFEKTIILTILISVFFLMLSNPFESPDSTYNQIELIIDIIVIVFYFLEILLKICAFGLIFSGKKPFLLDPWNLFDLCVFILTVLGTIASKNSFSTLNFKWFRVFRVFKIIQFNQGLKNAVNILFKSIPDLISLLFFYFMNLFIFGIIAVKFLKGAFFYCTTIDEKFLSFVKTREDCFDNGGDWVNRDLNFDNIFISLSSLFQISTTEGWIEEMFNGIDYVGIGKNPLKNNNSMMALFYISFFIISNLIMINMFIGILVETYLHQKNLNSPYAHLTEEQKEWAFIKENIYKMKPKIIRQPPKNSLRKLFYKMIKSSKFRNIMTGFNLLNILTFILYYHRQPKVMELILNYINIVIISIFTIEIFIIAIAQGSRFIKKFWNVFDVLIITSSWLGIILLVFMGLSQYRWVKSLINCIQVLRVARTIKSFRFLNKLFYTLISIIPQMANIAFLLFLFLISYSVCGVEFFAYLKPQLTVGNHELNFHNGFNSLLNLIRSFTGEQWFRILNDCARKQGPNFTCKTVDNYNLYEEHGLQGCGSNVAYAYFFSFHLIISLVAVNLFIAMIMNTYDEIMKAENSAINVYQLKEILILWKEFDPEGSGFITYRDFNRFFKKIAIQLGVNAEDFMDIKNRKDFLKLLNLSLYENTIIKMFCYRFHDVIISLAQIAVLFNYGNLELEPEEGIFSLEKYERKLLADKRFKITDYKSGLVMDFQVIMKYIKQFRMKKQGKERSNYIFDLFDLTNKLKNLKKNEEKSPQLIKMKREKSKEKSKIFHERSDSNKESYLETQNKAFGGMFFHSASKEQSKEKDNHN